MSVPNHSGRIRCRRGDGYSLLNIAAWLRYDVRLICGGKRKETFCSCSGGKGKQKFLSVYLGLAFTLSSSFPHHHLVFISAITLREDLVILIVVD